MSKLHIFNFKAEHRVAQSGIYHGYGYKFRPALRAQYIIILDEAPSRDGGRFLILMA